MTNHTASTESHIFLDPNGQFTIFVGSDGVLFHRVLYLREALRLWTRAKICITRGMTVTRLLKLTSEITHKPYKRTQATLAIQDLTIWLNAMRTTIPLKYES